MPNRLADESSPYLLQHANNPVDWYPWGPEALERAKAEDKPIFLSIGYAACHWCHVMEHESFENPRIAQLMNERFVNIKVDREERPDLDQIYMSAVQLLTGRGGWPMSVFLAPDLRPFYGGTYFPPSAGRGMPGFDQILLAIEDAWKNRRDEALESAEQLTHEIRNMCHMASSGGQLSLDLLHHAHAALSRQHDRTFGGFGSQPKFPHPMDLRLLLRVGLRDKAKHHDAWDMVRLTLDKMAGGGIYDQLGGGFHRYSVDARWLVPHFEKMLYDNALLAVCYVEAFQATGEPRYAQVVRETLDYVLREMTSPAGGFYSTLDADSEGEEGKFYVWSVAEIKQVLGEERGALFCRVYDVTPGGNFEGHNILNLPKTLAQEAALLHRNPDELAAEMAAARGELLQVRNKRVWPGLDDKVLTSWNALMIEALALAAGALGDDRYLKAAREAAEFLWNEMRRADGRLLHSWREGKAKFDAYLDDYTYFINALITLYEADFDERWIIRASALADMVLQHFSDAEAGGFYFTADDHEELIARQKDAHDASVPSGNGMAAYALLRLSKLTDNAAYFTAAERTLQLYHGQMSQIPAASGQLLLAADFYLGPTSALVLLADPRDPSTHTLLTSLRHRFLPHQVTALRPSTSPTGSSPLSPLFAGKDASPNTPTLFVCQNYSCQAPIVGLDAIREWLEGVSDI